jgi:hypothetical protein
MLATMKSCTPNTVIYPLLSNSYPVMSIGNCGGDSIAADVLVILLLSGSIYHSLHYFPIITNNMNINLRLNQHHSVVP